MNNKKWLRVKLGLLISIFIILLFISIGFINYSKLNSNHNGFIMMKNIPDVEGDRKVFSDIKKVVINSVSLPVHIYESDVSQVTIIDNSKAYGIGITTEPNTLSQDGETLYFKEGKRISFLSFTRGNIVVEVPKGSILEYDIRNIGGSIVHDAMSKETLKASSVSGSIRIHQGGEKVSANSTSGSVRIYSSFEDVSAQSVSGSVKLVANEDSKQVSASSTSGSVRIELENVSGYEMDYSTISGSVKDTYTNTSYSKSGSANHGDSSLKISASSISDSIYLGDWDN